ELARDARQGQEPIETADTVERREHPDGFEALGRMEVHVAREGVRYGGVDDESDNGDSGLRRLGAASAGYRPRRYTGRRARASLHCHGSVEYLLFRNAPNSRDRPGKDGYRIIPHSNSGYLSICNPAFGRKLRRPHLRYSVRTKALAENRENRLRRLAAPLKASAEESVSRRKGTESSMDKFLSRT